MTALGAAEIRTPDDAARFLAGLTASTATQLGAGAGRTRVRALLAMLGNPQDELRAVHVAGTAGKGSVVAFVSSMLAAHGFRIGAYLSPHVRSVTERFQLDGCPVEPWLLARGLDRLAAPVRAMAGSAHGRPTYFEVTTALAFGMFAERHVDYAVVETGIGGLHDATNAMDRPDKLAVVTAIGLDHTQVLGDTLAAIAAQKAGIMPVHGSAIAMRSEVDDVNRVLADEAAHRCCELELLDTAGAAADLTSRGGGRWTFSCTGTGGLTDLRPGPAGRHQVANAAVALRVLEKLAQRDGWTLQPAAVRLGLRRTALPGRFERLRWRDHELVLDGAHNPMKLASLRSTLQDAWPGRRFVWVLALKRDKDVAAALEVLAPVASTVVATQFLTPGGDHPPQSSVPPARLAAAARRAGVRLVRTEADPRIALERAVELSPADRPVVVSGSFELVAAVAAHVQR